MTVETKTSQDIEKARKLEAKISETSDKMEKRGFDSGLFKEVNRDYREFLRLAEKYPISIRRIMAISNKYMWVLSEAKKHQVHIGYYG